MKAHAHNTRLAALSLAAILAATPAAWALPKLKVLATGGTIAGAQATQADAGYKSGAFSVEDLIQAVPTDDLLGVVSGAAGNPAILAYANRALPSDRVDVAYATIFPSMTILKIVCVQVAMGVLGGHTSPGL